jgi:hypothetical protein
VCERRLRRLSPVPKICSGVADFSQGRWSSKLQWSGAPGEEEKRGMRIRMWWRKDEVLIVFIRPERPGGGRSGSGSGVRRRWTSNYRFWVIKGETR